MKVKVGLIRNEPITLVRKIQGKKYTAINYTRDKKFWLYRLLRRFGLLLETEEVNTVDYPFMESNYSVVELDTQDIYEKIHTLVENYRQHQRKMPTHVLLGGRQYTSMLANYPHTLVVPCELKLSRYRGLKIVIVPWMDGVIALSDDEL
jgi:hypothetical protein